MVMVPVLGFVVLVTVAAVILFLWTSMRVSRARTRHGVLPPAMTGPVEFERVLRVEANTLEQLVPFLAGLWLCALFFDKWAAVLLGIVWLAGRLWYVFAYSRGANRTAPFTIAFLATVLLLLGGAVGGVRLAMM